MSILYIIIGSGMNSWMDFVHQKVHGWWIGSVKMLPNLLLAIIVWILFFLIARFFRKLIYKLSQKLSRKKAVSGLFSNIVNVCIFAIGLYIGLNILKLDKIAISLLAGAGIVGLTLAFAFQDLTANFISGVYIDLNNPFEVGDIIGSNNIIGKVEDIGLRSTTIRTVEGLYLMVPNKNIFQNTIINYSKSEGRQIRMEFLISIQESLEEIKTMLVEAIWTIKGVDKRRKPEFYYTDIDQTKLKVAILFWVDTPQQSDDMLAKHLAILTILNTLKNNHIEMIKV